MKIVADENIVAVRDFFAPYGELLSLPGREISSPVLRDADVLLVRSITRVDETLLKDTAVKFVGSATSGIDHVDKDYLSAQGISFQHAPGANANSVVEYVFSALAALSQTHPLNWLEGGVGIIGGGNIGSLLARRLEALGISYRIYDPFLAEAGEQGDYSSWEEVLEQAVLSIHTPLTFDGPHPTYHLFSREVIEALRPGTLLINAARGAVVDNEALRQRLSRNNDLLAVLDVWEGEPAINLRLLREVALGTAHIAGYSFDGKLRGTRRIYEAFCRFFSLAVSNPDLACLAGHGLLKADINSGSELEVLNRSILQAYDIRRDHSALSASLRAEDPAALFDHLRKSYSRRLEFSNFRFPASLKAQARLQALGFCGA